MAIQQTIEYTDDLDGRPLAEDERQVVRFGFNGKIREMDVSAKHADQFDRAMQKYAEVSRVVGNLPASGPYAVPGQPVERKRGTDAVRSRDETAEIRAWARVNGWPDLTDRGRVPGGVLSAWASRALRDASRAERATKQATKTNTTKTNTTKTPAPTTKRPTAKRGSGATSAKAKRTTSPVPPPAFRSENEADTA